MKNPLFNISLPLPSCDVLVQRIMDNEVLQGYYRPDIWKDYWYKRPSKKEVNKSLKLCIDGLPRDTIWRTAREYGVFWNNHSSDDVLLRDVALTLYSQLGRSKV